MDQTTGAYSGTEIQVGCDKFMQALNHQKLKNITKLNKFFKVESIW